MAYTTIDDPSAHHQTKIYTGNGNDGQAYTFDGNSDMKPDWLWVKNRSNTGPYSGHIFDSTRGANKSFFPDADNAEATNSSYGYLGAFQSDGFTVTSGSSGDERVNNNNDTYVMWGWKANGGSRTTFTESGNNPGGGYQANTTAGFSIIDYTGTGGAGTVAHGLGVAPEFLIAKSRSASGKSWGVWHKDILNTHYLTLQTTNAKSDYAGFLNDTSPTSSNITLGDWGDTNGDGNTHIMYAFAPIQGYSKFGSYAGNGSTDGPFVYTGFKPAWVMLKRSSGVADWNMFDNKRPGYNETNARLRANDSTVESTSDAGVDLLSNGFKCRLGSEFNASSTTNIYMAFAESPFVSSKGVPTTAR